MTDPAELIAAIETYHSIGLPVIPFYVAADGKKKPIIDAWQKWKTQPQTDAEFKEVAAKVLETRLFGVVTGTKITIDGESYYFMAVDRDTKDPELNEEIKQKSKQAIGLMRTTRMEGTMNKGEHLHYYSRNPASGKKLNKIGMELLGIGQICVMYPSEGYTRINDNSPTVVDSAEDIFFDAIEQAGLTPKRTRKTAERDFSPLKQYRRKPLRPCFKKLMDKDHLEHLEKVALVYELHYCGAADQEIYELFHDNKAWEPAPNHTYSAVETDSQIKYTLDKAKGGSFRYLKETLQQMQICQADCPFISETDCRKVKAKQSERINPVADIAKVIENKYKFIVDKVTKVLYVYDEKEGIYTDETEDLISNEICNMLDDETRVKYYKDVDYWIRHNSKTPRVKLDPDNNLVCFNNGVLDIKKKELLSFNSDFHLTNKVPHDYDKDEKAPLFQKFLSEVYVKESQRKQLQEIMGKTLARKNRLYHIILILNGDGNNGKSVLLDFIGFCLGKANVSTVTLQALSNDKFERAKIKDKMANICADLPSELMRHIGPILEISGGDPITIQNKYEDPIPNYEPNISLLFSCNEAPSIPESGDHRGTYRRIVMHDFEIVFEPATPENPAPAHPEDKHLREKLMIESEASGAINWFLEGYDRLEQQGEITDRPSVNNTRIAYIRRSDPPHAYIIDCLTDTAENDDIIFEDPLYREFIQYCVDHKLTRRSKGVLTQAIRKWAPGAEHTKASLDPERKDSERKPCWRYLRRKTEGERKQAQNEGPDKQKIDSYSQNLSDLSGLSDQSQILSKNISQNENEKNKLFETGRTTRTTRTDLEPEQPDQDGRKGAYPNRYCRDECKNYPYLENNTQGCPWGNRLPKDNLLPLNCYGYAAP